MTGSYDKKINLFSYAKGKSVTTLSNNKTSVTSMVMTSDKLRLVSSGLDSSLSVWTIVRKNDVKNLFISGCVEATTVLVSYFLDSSTSTFACLESLDSKLE